MRFEEVEQVASTLPIDPVVSFIVGALGAAILTVLGGLLVLWLTTRSDHARWVRSERIAAYGAFLKVAETTWAMQSPDRAVWRAHMDDMASALAPVRIVGPDSIATAAEKHMDAALNFGSIQRKVNGVENGVPQPSLDPELQLAGAASQATRAAFVAVARKHLKFEG